MKYMDKYGRIVEFSQDDIRCMSDDSLVELQHSLDEWDPDLVHEIVERADMLDAYNECDPDDTEKLVFAAMHKLSQRDEISLGM